MRNCNILSGEQPLATKAAISPLIPIAPGPGYMILAALSFSIMSAMVKAGGHNLPAQEMVLVRSLIVFTILAVLIKRQDLPLWGVDRKNLLLRGFFGFCGLSCFFWTLTQIPITDATLLQYTNPLFTALLAIGILRERDSAANWGYFLLAFTGVLLIIRPGFSMQMLPALVGLTGAMFSALAYNWVRKLRHTDHLLHVMLYFPAVSILLSLPFVMLNFVMPQPLDWVLLAGVGLFALLGQWLLTRALHLDRAGRVMNMIYLGVVFSTIWGILFFDEIPDLPGLAGAVLVIFALLRIAAVENTTPPNE